MTFHCQLITNVNVNVYTAIAEMLAVNGWVSKVLYNEVNENTPILRCNTN